MSEKRRDSKGRLLKTGESQRADGKYEYKYDIDGERRSVYSWRLVSTDKLPPGKRNDKSLREKEKEISDRLRDGCNPIVNTTLNESIEKNLYLRKIGDTTLENYLCYYNKHIKPTSLGRKKAVDIKRSDILALYSKYSKLGYSDGSIQILHKIIHPALQMMVDDGDLKRNPADKCCKDYSDTNVREALSPKEREIFYDDILTDKYHYKDRYLPIFIVMQGLACRINELAGLTWSNIDFSERTVTIDHGICYRSRGGSASFYVTKGSCKNRARSIPMTTEVYNCLLDLYNNRHLQPASITVDGYTDFVFRSKSGTPLYPNSINKAIRRMINKYNEANGTNFPQISNHIFRHTGCTIMAEAEVDPNSLMYIMGHKNLKMIYNVYDTINQERIRKQIDKVDAQKQMLNS